jgi:hypothetical protein
VVRAQITMRKQRFGWPVRWAGLGRNTQTLPYLHPSRSRKAQSSFNSRAAYPYHCEVFEESITSSSPAYTPWLPRGLPAGCRKMRAR